MSQENPLITNNLCCRRGGRQLFDNVSIKLTHGQLLHVTGANGSGKSTLLRILCGLYDNSAGSIDQNVQHMHYLGHLKANQPNLTVQENAQFDSLLTDQTLNMSIEQALQQLALYDERHRLAAQLSAGQQQRLALLRLLLIPAQLWLLDEPFTALDEKGKGILASMIESFLQQGGMVIITSHNALPMDHSDTLKLHLGDAHE